MPAVRPEVFVRAPEEIRRGAMSLASTSNVFAVVPPHVIVANAFGQDMVERLMAHVLAREADFADTQVGSQGATRRAVRRSRKLRELGPIAEALAQRFRAALPAAQAALGMSPFSVAALELELAAHGDGDYYQRHIDTFVGAGRRDMDRVLTAVYYFHRVPRAFSGGALRLCSLLPPEQGGAWIDVEPRSDSLLLFPAWAPHEVLPVSCPGGDFAGSRFAINCWYKLARAAG
jgi:Rps23 Pro-64 3,4-dihydroxylase Tpa1-like proline 4-hydroxylase